MAIRLLVSRSTEPDKVLSDQVIDKPAVEIGRSPTCDLVLSDPDNRVSRQHARLEMVDGSLAVKDYGSTNGTYINGVRMEPKGCLLVSPSDKIKLGGFLVRAEVAGRAPSGLQQRPADAAVTPLPAKAIEQRSTAKLGTLSGQRDGETIRTLGTQAMPVSATHAPAPTPAPAKPSAPMDDFSEMLLDIEPGTAKPEQAGETALPSEPPPPVPEAMARQASDSARHQIQTAEVAPETAAPAQPAAPVPAVAPAPEEPVEDIDDFEEDPLAKLDAQPLPAPQAAASDTALPGSDSQRLAMLDDDSPVPGLPEKNARTTINPDVDHAEEDLPLDDDAAMGASDPLAAASYKVLKRLSQTFLGEAGFQQVGQVELFGRLLEQTLEISLEWLSRSLKGRSEFEGQFEAFVTMAFKQQKNELAAVKDALEMRRMPLDWRKNPAPEACKEQLEGAYRKLTDHQLGMLSGVQEALATVMRRIEPKMIEAEVKASAKGLSKLFGNWGLAKRAWLRYVSLYAEELAETQKLFNQSVFPSIRRGYLEEHSRQIEQKKASKSAGALPTANVQTAAGPAATKAQPSESAPA